MTLLTLSLRVRHANTLRTLLLLAALDLLVPDLPAIESAAFVLLDRPFLAIGLAALLLAFFPAVASPCGLASGRLWILLHGINGIWLSWLTWRR